MPGHFGMFVDMILAVNASTVKTSSLLEVMVQGVTYWWTNLVENS